MPQDPPGRKRKATLRACGSRDRGLFWYSTHALDFGYEALCLTRKSPKLRIALDACGYHTNTINHLLKGSQAEEPKAMSYVSETTKGQSQG